MQGWILVACGWLAVMAPQVIAPVLPTIATVFKDTPHVDLLVPFLATGTSLFVALAAPLFGSLGDRYGHRRLLLWATLVYGLAGTAPLWLPTLELIAASRSLVGIAEAAAMTCGTALIGQYFEGRRREHYLAWQTGTATLAAVLVNAIAGAFGDSSWRLPFAIYGFALLLTALVGLGLPDGPHARVQAKGEPAPEGEAFPWRHLLPICGATLFGMTAFVLILVQTGFLLTERGMAAPRLIGLWSSVAMVASPVGTVIFSVARCRSTLKLALTFAFFGAGFFVMAWAMTWQMTIVGVSIAYLGAGMILPTTITWGLSTLSATQRGKGTGIWVASTFLGQFIGPFCVLGLRQLTHGSLPGAVAIYAIACTIAAAIALTGSLRSRLPSALTGLS
jgi:MFS family permease